jgi:hypothetical protein
MVMTHESTQLMYHGEWIEVEAGAFEIITALADAVSDDLLVFSELDSGRTLWLRAGQIDAVLTGDEREEHQAEWGALANALGEELVLREQSPRECERRPRRHLGPRIRGDR